MYVQIYYTHGNILHEHEHEPNQRRRKKTVRKFVWKRNIPPYLLTGSMKKYEMKMYYMQNWIFLWDTLHANDNNNDDDDKEYDEDQKKEKQPNKIPISFSCTNLISCYVFRPISTLPAI